MEARLVQAARSVDAPTRLIPVLADLFHGIDSLGSSPTRVVRMLRRAGLGSRSTLLDLGCGKGAACVAIARQLGWRCTGIDAVPGFVAAARELAARKGVASRCRFRVGDLRAATGRFDAAIMLGVLDVVRARRVLRTRIRRGGVYLIDDAVGNGGERLTLAGARRALSKDGDEIISEDIWTADEVQRQEKRLYDRMERNAARLASVRPDLAQALKTFLQRQRDAARMLQRELRPVQWMVRRG